MLERIMIVSGESSGELYGALLAKALKARNPEITIIGVGGDRMQTAGVNLISRISSSFGITEAIKTYSEIKKTFEKVVNALKSFNPQVLVLIDYPDFNMRVAREAKKLGIKVLYYVSPQVWAWRKGRVKTIGKLIDKMAVILPFEGEIYKHDSIPCEFVGHPILDEIREEIRTTGYSLQDTGTPELKAAVRKELGLIPDRPVMTLMPGSRIHEIKKLIPVMSDVIAEVHRLYPDYQFVVPVAPNLSHDALSVMNELEKNTHHALCFTHHAIRTLLASDIAVIASGTSALQAALVGVPMVVVYKLSSLTYFIGRLIVNVKHISLVNILLDYIEGQGEFLHGLRIKELLQKEAHKENIIMELNKIMDDVDYRNEMVSQMKRVRELFMDKEASSMTAGILEELVANNNV